MGREGGGEDIGFEAFCQNDNTLLHFSKDLQSLKHFKFTMYKDN